MAGMDGVCRRGLGAGISLLGVIARCLVLVAPPPSFLPHQGGGSAPLVGTIQSKPQGGTSPLMGEAGRGCESPDVGAKPPPPLIPPHKGEGADCIIAGPQDGQGGA